MMKERLLTNTEPIDVFHYFEDLTFIPRESGNEKEEQKSVRQEIEYARRKTIAGKEDGYI